MADTPGPSDPSDPPVILILGPVAVRGDGVGVSTPRSRRQRVLLALLASRVGRVVPSDELVEALWADGLPENPTAALHSQAHRLRRALEPVGAGVVGDPAGYRLDCAADRVDAFRFEELVELGRAYGTDRVQAIDVLDRALALWRGRAFGDVADGGSLAADAARLDELRAAAAEERAALLLSAGRHREAEEAAAAVQDEHPYREGLVAVRMRALAREGRAVDALRLYERFRRQLRDELGIEPSATLSALEGEILRHGSRAPPAVGLPGNSFVGREVELADISALLERARVVTLTGPGGVGKTRLALHVANRVAHRYPDGVHLCELAPVTDTGAVAGAVAAALQVEEGSERDFLQRIVAVLRPQRALLLLDNCEHVVADVAAVVRAIVARTPSVAVLATSRQRIGVEGEHVVAVGPLPTDAEGVASELYLDRAAAAGSPVQTHPAGRAAIDALCARLEGLPLAIELAAARSVARIPEELLADVAGRLDQLADHRRPVERHRSIEATVSWSYDLLSRRAQSLLQVVSVFAGGWTADAAAAVSGEPVEDVVDALTELVEHSLVSARRLAGSTRYSLLEPIRQYADHRLSGNARQSLAAAHARWAAAWMQRADSGLRTEDEPHWVAAVEDELANLRAAHSWCMEHEPPLAADIVASLFWYAYWYGTAEVFDWADRTVELLADVDAAGVAGALATAACGAWRRGDLAGSRALAERGIDRAGDAHPGAARFTWEALRSAELLGGRYERALACREQTLVLARAADDRVHEAHARATGALILGYLGRREDAEAELALAAELIARQDHPTARAFHDYVTGEVRVDTAPAEALPFLRRSADAARRCGNRFLAGIAGASAISCAVRVGDASTTIGDYAEVLAFFHRAGAWPQLWTSMRSLVQALTALDRFEAAAVLYGALTSSPTAPEIRGPDDERMAGVVAELRAHLGEQRLAELRSEGAALSDEEAYARALRAAR